MKLPQENEKVPSYPVPGYLATLSPATANDVKGINFPPLVPECEFCGDPTDGMVIAIGKITGTPSPVFMRIRICPACLAKKHGTNAIIKAMASIDETAAVLKAVVATVAPTN